jgi:hypothetical protein
MAHYALINQNNIVVQVITGVDEHIIQTDLDGKQVGGSEKAWENFYASRPWFSGLICKRTSYNRNIRKNFACVGYTYDEERDAFIAPKPFNSWILDEATCRWQAPTPMPTTEGKRYYWSEDDLSWREIPNE